MAALISFQIYPFMICVCIKPRRLDGNHMPTATENSVWIQGLATTGPDAA